MVASIIMIALALAWLMYETDFMRVRLLVGLIPSPLPVERISWVTCILRYPALKLSPGVESPICGWDWLRKNTHPIPRVVVDFTSGGVRYHWDIKDCNILKDAITATHAKPRNGHSRSGVRRNKFGGLIARLPGLAN